MSRSRTSRAAGPTRSAGAQPGGHGVVGGDPAHGFGAGAEPLPYEDGRLPAGQGLRQLRGGGEAAGAHGVGEEGDRARLGAEAVEDDGCGRSAVAVAERGGAPGAGLGGEAVPQQDGDVELGQLVVRAVRRVQRVVVHGGASGVSAQSTVTV
ncbi:hypothetical protein [Streptomyces sp. CB03238]|uniref:hypothetical protein n=1 Tax=Streptomyces sp. CB03238 TaxID=1907777 RepID=UPI0015C4D2C4|nr:hypothetical protein [Streptomyces sp. CB03238]